jgi:hypothetical protein
MPVLRAVPALARESAVGELLRETCLEKPGEIRGVDFACRQLEQFLPTVSQTPTSRRIGVENAPVQVVHEHGIVDRIE